MIHTYFIHWTVTGVLKKTEMWTQMVRPAILLHTCTTNIHKGWKSSTEKH